MPREKLSVIQQRAIKESFARNQIAKLRACSVSHIGCLVCILAAARIGRAANGGRITNFGY
jgi:hypothetical protein